MSTPVPPPVPHAAALASLAALSLEGLDGLSALCTVLRQARDAGVDVPELPPRSATAVLQPVQLLGQVLEGVGQFFQGLPGQTLVAHTGHLQVLCSTQGAVALPGLAGAAPLCWRRLRPGGGWSVGELVAKGRIGTAPVRWR